MIKAIIFDCWSTLFYDNIHPHPYVEFAHSIGKDMTDYDYLKIFEKTFMLKIFDNVEDPIKKLLDQLNIRVDDDKFGKLVKIMEKIGSSQKAYPDVLDNLKKLKKSYKLGLLSNTFSRGIEKLDEKFNLSQYFDAIFKSYEIKLIKPNPKIFKIALARMGVNKDEVIMVGDSLPDDVQVAEHFGIKGVLLDRRNRYPQRQDRITSLNELYRFL